MSNKTITYLANAGDCWCNKPATPAFDSTSGDLYVGGTNTVGDDITTWIPFTVTLPKNKVIVSASLQVVATGTDAFNPCDVIMGCEAADNPANPTNLTDLRARVMTTANIAFSISAETAGSTYNYDVTAAVQEIINRAGWSPSNTLAVLIKDGVTGSARWRRWASVENVTYPEPKLLVTIDSFIPRGGTLV